MIVDLSMNVTVLTSVFLVLSRVSVMESLVSVLSELVLIIRWVFLHLTDLKTLVLVEGTLEPGILWIFREHLLEELGLLNYPVISI
jgi:hypothetical protein